MKEDKVLILQTQIGDLKIEFEDGVLTYCKWMEKESENLLKNKNIVFLSMETIQQMNIKDKDKLLLKTVLIQFAEFFSGIRKYFNIPFKFKGTDFQNKIWKTISEIPYGETLSYSLLAKKIGNPKSVRAVANACGANPICILVPCHRIIGSNGYLGGYTGGIEKKIKLLELERKQIKR